MLRMSGQAGKSDVHAGGSIMSEYLITEARVSSPRAMDAARARARRAMFTLRQRRRSQQ